MQKSLTFTKSVIRFDSHLIMLIYKWLVFFPSNRCGNWGLERYEFDQCHRVSNCHCQDFWNLFSTFPHNSHVLIKACSSLLFCDFFLAKCHIWLLIFRLSLYMVKRYTVNVEQYVGTCYCLNHFQFSISVKNGSGSNSKLKHSLKPLYHIKLICALVYKCILPVHG